MTMCALVLVLAVQAQNRVIMNPDYDKPNPSGVQHVHRIAALYDLIETAADSSEEFVHEFGFHFFWQIGHNRFASACKPPCFRMS